MKNRFSLVIASATLLTLVLACGCSRGLSNCKRNAGDTWRQAGKDLRSWDVLGSAVDVVMMPVTTTADCARDIAVSPIQELQAQNVQRKITAVRVTPEQAEVARQRPVVAPTADGAAVASAKDTQIAAQLPAKKQDPCGYRTACVAASTLVVEGGRRSDASQQAPKEHAQYEITNNCGEPVECFVCGTRAGAIVRGESGGCDDGSKSRLDIGETWVSQGSVQGIDGMSLTCLLRERTEQLSCRTWPH